MHFGMYFEMILSKKWLLSCRNSIHTNYSCTDMLGSSGAYMLALLRKLIDEFL